MVRELVLSSTFRMAGTSTPEAEASDPDNRLLHEMRVRRLEAEAIRDAILAVAGRLDGRMAGPGVEVHLTTFMDNYADSYGRPKTSGPLDGNGRRSLYVNVRRNFLTPILTAFDFPPPLVTAGRRDVSNVPAQALILMNDPFVAQQARRLGRARAGHRGPRREWPGPSDVPGGLRAAAVGGRVEGGPAVPREPRQRAGHTPERRRDDERLWADFAHVLINVKEFIFLK